MTDLFFTPGPSHLQSEVQGWLNEAIEQNVFSMSHRSSEYCAMHARTVTELKMLLACPDDYQVFFLGSATEAMERILQNMVERRSHHLVNGAFSKKFYQIADELGKQPSLQKVDYGHGFKAGDVKVPKDAELVCFTHNETSTGVMLPKGTIAAAKQQQPDVLVAVDIVSSAPFIDFDWHDVDAAFLSVQKAFGLPAGLGVLIVSPAALAKAHEQQKAGASIGSYHSFVSLAASAEKNQTPETPNVLGIYLLGKVAEKFNSIGIGELRKQAAAKQLSLHEAIENHPELDFFVTDPAFRSVTVIIAQTKGDNGRLHKQLASQGFHVGKGYKDYKERHLRIANFSALSEEQARQLAHLLNEDAG